MKCFKAGSTLLYNRAKEISEVKFNLENMECDDCKTVEKAMEMLSELIRVYQTELHKIVRLERKQNDNP